MSVLVLDVVVMVGEFLLFVIILVIDFSSTGSSMCSQSKCSIEFPSII